MAGHDRNGWQLRSGIRTAHRKVESREAIQVGLWHFAASLATQALLLVVMFYFLPAALAVRLVIVGAGALIILLQAALKSPAVLSFYRHRDANMSGLIDPYMEEAIAFDQRLQAFAIRKRAQHQTQTTATISPDTSAFKVMTNPVMTSQPVAHGSYSALPPLTIESLIAELDHLNNPGFDAILISVDMPQGISPADRAEFEHKYRDALINYGLVRVPVRIVDVSGVESGNAIPALETVAYEAEFRKSLDPDKKHKPKIFVIEAYGPQFDPAKLMAGSTFFTPVGHMDSRNQPVTTGALALAHASKVMRSMAPETSLRVPSDTFSSHQFQPHLLGDITFATVPAPAAEAARNTVVIQRSANETEIVGLIENAAPQELDHLAKKAGQVVSDKGEIHVLTADVAVHITDTEKQKKFDTLVKETAAEWKAQVAAHPGLELDEVSDFWMPVVLASNGEPNGRETLQNFSRHRAGVNYSRTKLSRSEKDARLSIYSPLHLALFDAVHALNLKIHAQLDSQARMQDVRNMKDWADFLRDTAATGTIIKLVEAGRLLSAGLNGATSKLQLQKEGFMFALPLKPGNGQPATEVVFYGLQNEFRNGRKDSFAQFGQVSERMLNDAGQPLFSETLSFSDRPIFPTGAVTEKVTNELARLIDGQTIQFPVHSPDELRAAGYISLNDITRRIDQGGLKAPVFQHAIYVPMKPLRSEARSQNPRSKLISQGVLAAAALIFYGILPLETGAYAGSLAANEFHLTMQFLKTDLAAAVMPQNFKAVSSSSQVQPANTLFIEAAVLPPEDLLSRLEIFSQAPFKIKVLFTPSQKGNYEKAKNILGLAQKRNLSLQTGPTVQEMIIQQVRTELRSNPDLKNQFAFFGSQKEARHVRPYIGNLVEFNSSHWPAVLIWQALQSPAIFNLYSVGSANRIWTIQNLVPVLLAAQTVTHSA